MPRSAQPLGYPSLSKRIKIVAPFFPYMARVSLLLCILTLAVLSSCSVYKRDLMFQTDGMPDSLLIKTATNVKREMFKIQPFDWIELHVYSNGGEQLVDPNSEFGKQLGETKAQGMSGGLGGGMVNMQLIGTTNPGRHQIGPDGTVRLPLLGTVKLGHLTYREADSLLSEKYSNFYEDAYVITRTSNRRAIVFTGAGSSLNLQAMNSGARVIQLTDDGITLPEALAQAGGIGAYADVENIRIIRGSDLQNPKVIVANLSRITTMAQSDLRIMPNDIIYVEPLRRPAVDVIRDFAPLVSVGLSVATIFLLLVQTR